MINPNRMHRARAIIEQVSPISRSYIARLVSNRAPIQGWDLPLKFKDGDLVNIQASYSICLEQYTVKSVNKVRVK